MNRVYSRSVFHMGTGGPKRFNMPHHSAEIRLVHPEFGLKAFTQLMMDTGGVGAVCDPRQQAPVKDVMQLNSPCRLNSGYEIWSTEASVMANGREVYRAFATPAVFDPITLFNPANPTEVVYAWDARVSAIKNFPGDDWSGNRGCDRESYAQPGYWYNGSGQTAYYTDAMGQPLASDNPLALRQEISTSEQRRIAGHDRRSQPVQDAQGLLPAELEAGPEELSAPTALRGRCNSSVHAAALSTRLRAAGARSRVVLRERRPGRIAGESRGCAAMFPHPRDLRGPRSIEARIDFVRASRGFREFGLRIAQPRTPTEPARVSLRVRFPWLAFLGVRFLRPTVWGCRCTSTDVVVVVCSARSPCLQRRSRWPPAITARGRRRRR